MLQQFAIELGPIHGKAVGCNGGRNENRNDQRKPGKSHANELIMTTEGYG
jgi:hypothetical protein